MHNQDQKSIFTYKKIQCNNFGKMNEMNIYNIEKKI